MSDARAESRRNWGSVAASWKARAAEQSGALMPVSTWLVDAIAPQPGHTVLELAAGTGDVGFLAAELIQPGGTLICSDWSPEMLTGAQERAADLGVHNVRFKQIDAQAIDLEAASIDGVLCRCGYMLMPDAGAALRETRRVLRRGGRVALSVWTASDDNPMVGCFGGAIVELGLAEQPPPDEPGPFAWAEPGTIEDALAGAGFVEDIVVETVDLEFRFPDGFEQWWGIQRELSMRLRDAVERADAGAVEHLKETVRERSRQWEQAGGALHLPGRMWVARATA